MDMRRPPMDYEFNSYDHVAFTSDAAWEPMTLDNETDLTVLNTNLKFSIMPTMNTLVHACQTLGRKAPSALLRKCLWNVATAIGS